MKNAMVDGTLSRARWATFAALSLVLSFYLITQAPWAIWLSIPVALGTSALLTAVLEFWLRLSLQRAPGDLRSNANPYRQEALRQNLQIALKLQRTFLDAHTENEILSAVLETGLTIFQAAGASFVPYDEWGQALPALIQGKVPVSSMQGFSKRLTSPETRQACKSCQLMHGQPGCVLIDRDEFASNATVHCFPLPSGGREIGVFNFFFDSAIEPDNEARRFMNEIIQSSSRALDMLGSRNKEIAALLYLQTATTPKSELPALLKSLVENILKTLEVEFALLYIPGEIPGQFQGAPQIFVSQNQIEAAQSSIPEQSFLDGIWQSVQASGRSLTLENVSSVRQIPGLTLHAIPLNWQDQGPEGVLVLGSNNGHAFAQRYQALLETLAGQAALLIQNSRLMVQLEYQAVVDERTRLAREIHDGLAQTLAFLKMQSSQMQAYLLRGDLERLTNMLQASHRTLSDAYIDARQAIENLRRNPSSSLSDWVRQVATDYERSTGQTVNLAGFKLTADYPPNVQAQLIRIIQEALSNIRKHAVAGRIELRGSQGSDFTIIEICDDGQGFAPEQVDVNARFGLRGMRERAESIGADFQIASQPGGGTIVSLRMPVAVKEKL